MFQTATRKTVLFLSATLLATGMSASARASSDDAWAEFARIVEKACKAAVQGTYVKPRVIVDPYGSETYGLAIVTGKLKAGGTGSQICVYGKQSQKAEVGSELSPEQLKIVR